MSESKAEENKAKAEEHPHKRHVSSKDDEDEEQSALYIPKKGNSAKLITVTPSKHPEIKKYLSMTKPELQKWLRHNAQLVTGRKHELLLRCVDGQINGRIPGCPRCHHGQMQYDYSNENYVCRGYFDKMSKTPIACGHSEAEVKREPWRDIEKDSPVNREASNEGEGGGKETQHHKDNPDHHHDEHHCKVEANHPLVDLLEDMAYYHSVLKDENWGYRARAFKTAARAVEELDFEVTNAKDLSNKGSHHVERIGESSAKVMQSFLDSGKQQSSELDDLKGALKKKERESKD